MRSTQTFRERGKNIREERQTEGQREGSGRTKDKIKARNQSDKGGQKHKK